MRNAILSCHPQRSCAGNEYVCYRVDIAYLTYALLVLVSGWSDNGWLSGGHAVRMAMELCKPILLCFTCYNN